MGIAGHDTEDGGRSLEQPAETYAVRHRRGHSHTDEETKEEERPSEDPWRPPPTVQCDNEIHSRAMNMQRNLATATEYVLPLKTKVIAIFLIRVTSNKIIFPKVSLTTGQFLHSFYLFIYFPEIPERRFHTRRFIFASHWKP